MKAVDAHPEARAEIKAAARWYEDQKSELGVEFAVAVEDAFAKIRANPKGFPFRSKGIRRCPLERFPYNVFYVERASAAWVMAVSHIKRHPDYWKNRLQDIP